MGQGSRENWLRGLMGSPALLVVAELRAGWASVCLRVLSPSLPVGSPWASLGILAAWQPQGSQIPYMVTEGFKSKYCRLESDRASILTDSFG